MVDLGEPEVLVGQGPKAPQRGVDVDPPRDEIREQLPDGFPIHPSASGGARGAGWRSPTGIPRDPPSRRRSRSHGGAARSPRGAPDWKSTRLNSSHVRISYAVFCLKKKKKKKRI